MKMIGLQNTLVDFVYITQIALRNVEWRILSHIDKVLAVNVGKKCSLQKLIPQYIPGFSDEIVPNLQGFT